MLVIIINMIFWRAVECGTLFAGREARSVVEKFFLVVRMDLRSLKILKGHLLLRFFCDREGWLLN